MSSNNNRSKPQQHRRAAAKPVISLTQFAHAKSKGTRRAIEKFRTKKKSKFNRNAGLLREYRKAMKSEGYDAGKGASRKRSLGDSSIQNDEHDEHDDHDDHENPGTGEKPDTRSIIDGNVGGGGRGGEGSDRKKKRHKSDPFMRAKEIAKRNKEDQQNRKKMRIEEMEENERKMKQKKSRARMMTKKTSRGQPIMKNIVGDLLDKIKKSTDE